MVWAEGLNKTVSSGPFQTQWLYRSVSLWVLQSSWAEAYDPVYALIYQFLVKLFVGFSVLLWLVGKHRTSLAWCASLSHLISRLNTLYQAYTNQSELLDYQSLSEKRVWCLLYWVWWGPFPSAWSPSTAHLRISPVQCSLCRVITAGSCSLEEEEGKPVKRLLYPGPIGTEAAAKDNYVIFTKMGCLPTWCTLSRGSGQPSSGKWGRWKSCKLSRPA